LGEKRNLEGAARVHFTSEQERQECDAAGISVSAMVVPHGVDVPAASVQERSSDGLSVVFLSRLDPKKGLERLIEGFARTAVRLPEATLTIAGEGDPSYQRTLVDLASATGHKGISFSGWVEGEEKSRLLERADIFVLPSYSENFGVAVLEALSFGKPVVLTQGVALSQQVRDAGAGLIIEGTPESIEVALRQLADNPALRKSMGSAGRALALDQFSWPAVAGQLVEHYREAVKQR